MLQSVLLFGVMEMATLLLMESADNLALDLHKAKEQVVVSFTLTQAWKNIESWGMVASIQNNVIMILKPGMEDPPLY